MSAEPRLANRVRSMLISRRGRVHVSASGLFAHSLFFPLGKERSTKSHEAARTGTISPSCHFVDRFTWRVAISQTKDTTRNPIRGSRTSGAWYNWFMFEVSPPKEMFVRIIRDGQAEPIDDERDNSSPEERIEAVWTLTRLCLAWNNQLTNEPRLQRTITCLQRSSR